MGKPGKQKLARFSLLVLAISAGAISSVCINSVQLAAAARPGGGFQGPSSVRSTAPTSGPASQIWDGSAKGVKVKYPADWQPRNNPDYELMLIPVGAAGGERRITIDVPDLPPHFAFMIQMGRVERGYIEDLKKDHPDVQINEAIDAHLPECKARLIRSTWHQKNQAFDDVALLMIHAGDVYILDAQTEEATLPATQTAFDLIESSIVWTKH